MSDHGIVVHAPLEPNAVKFYTAGVKALHDAGVPFLVGGAYAMAPSTGIERDTKDFDIFLRPQDVDHALVTLANAGCRTELTFPHWLAKAYSADDLFIDLIFSSGNGVATVDDEWFQHAIPSEVLGVPMLLIPPEEMLWSKSFVTERERYDGADIAHLFRARAATLDWNRLLRRFGLQWRVLLSHLVLFGFIYPSHRHQVPQWIMNELLSRIQSEMEIDPPETHVCNGTLLSREQYLVDIREWGYDDARLRPDVRMTPDDIAHWTEAINGENGHA